MSKVAPTVARPVVHQVLAVAVAAVAEPRVPLEARAAMVEQVAGAARLAVAVAVARGESGTVQMGSFTVVPAAMVAMVAMEVGAPAVAVAELVALVDR